MRRFPLVVLVLALTGSASTAGRDLAAVHVKLTKIADVTRGTAMAVRTGDHALYVALQGGRIVAVSKGNIRTVLDLRRRVSSDGEQGLLGVAFSADGSKLYVHFSDTGGNTNVEEYAFGDTGPDLSTRRRILRVRQPQPNHNGGQLTIGPDGMLYLALGDGGNFSDVGSGHAPGGNAQSRSTLLGKILRIDPTHSGVSKHPEYTIPPDNPFAHTPHARPEIWAYGLRNPWRFSFDRSTNDVWIGDVGEGDWEEIDRVPFDRIAGSNFGWNVLEGTHDLRGGRVPGKSVLPVFETSHADGNCAITGGYVYRGSRIPDLVGAYLFSDFCNSNVRALTVVNGQVAAERNLHIGVDSVSSFGQDLDGELYVISQTKGIFRIDPA